MNHYFSFKQFTVQQQFCAMKVCTDACILGAFTATTICKNEPTKILDIGAGTGLLSLMLAQKNNCPITAIEIDKEAYIQCTQNFEASPWQQQLQAIHADIQYAADVHNQYDCIISNPPFFEDDILSTNNKKNTAKHATTLTLQQLLVAVEKLLTANGSFYVLIPYNRLAYFTNIAAALQLLPSNILEIKQTPNHQYFRAIVVLQKQAVHCQTQSLTIKEMDGTYSNACIALLKDYYLYL